MTRRLPRRLPKFEVKEDPSNMSRITAKYVIHGTYGPRIGRRSSMTDNILAEAVSAEREVNVTENLEKGDNALISDGKTYHTR